MSNEANSSVPSESLRLDPLTLWLNYENKIDELRSRFLTIASLLFTLQSGIFALMLDKIFLSDKPSLLALPAEIFLVIISVLTLVLLFIIGSLYGSHMETNCHRSDFIVGKSNAIKEFKKNLEKYLRCKQPKYKERTLKGVIYHVWVMCGLLLLFTIGVPVLRRILN